MLVITNGAKESLLKVFSSERELEQSLTVWKTFPRRWSLNAFSFTLREGETLRLPLIDHGDDQWLEPE
jgi:hypothetical protein